ncbi:MAG: AraC family ligand binding domain-containing protein [Proteobacteria bacterium]|nr:AraC family ligand binding domain-containing protein [Pseudomonadota bacterium]
MTHTALMLHWPRGLDATRFLQRHWQKEPLLVRGAFPGFRDGLPRSRLAALASREDVESRLVSHATARGGDRYRVDHGPLGRRQLARLDRPDATILVQGVNLHVPGVRPVLDAFGFIPLARRDDLMVSDASPGGGVGPHVDSYDVFLLQARGRRLWRIARTFDETLVEDAPLKQLAHFEAEDEFLLEPGDFLYLPPGVAHDGVALDACATWSIGFRAPSAGELLHGWLSFVEDRFDGDERYADPDLQLQRSGAWLSDQFVERARGLLGRAAFDESMFERFLGEYLTEPKDSVRFRAPSRPRSIEVFAAWLRQRHVVLAPATAMLHRGLCVYVNGEARPLPARAMPSAARLADRRELAPGACIDGAWTEALYDWYCSGYLVLR